MQQSEKAVLFDIDGTLTCVDTEALVEKHFQGLEDFFAGRIGFHGAAKCIWDGYYAMAVDVKRQATNQDVFEAEFARVSGLEPDIFVPLFKEYYKTLYPKLGCMVGPKRDGKKAVQKARELGYRVIAATNPLFPYEAAVTRLSWGGLLPADFDLTTAFEEYHSIKPNPAFFLEVAKKIGLPPEACIMAGNDVQEDLIARKTGMKIFFVDDHAINRGDHVPECPRGSLDDFCRWLEGSDQKNKAGLCMAAK